MEIDGCDLEVHAVAVNEITEKLNELITEENAFTQEKDVVYFLVQLRKLMEREDILKDHKSVKFYCDWVVHPNKKHNHGDVVGIYETIYQECVSFYSEDTEIAEGVLALMQFESLKSDLVPLLGRYNLDQAALGRLWIRFTKSLLSILNDQPLVEPSDKIKEIVISIQDSTYVTKITFVDPIIDHRGYRHPVYTYGLEYQHRN